MKLTVVVDNLCVKSGLVGEWGFSAWLEDGETDTHVLLDTGARPLVLKHNLQALGLNPKRLSKIVLSHNHKDHTGGLDYIREEASKAEIFASKNIFRPKRGDADAKRPNNGVPSSLSPIIKVFDEKAEITDKITVFSVPSASRMACFMCQKNLWEVQEDGSVIPDRFEDDASLLIKTDKGYSLILGCAHTGLPNILRYLKKEFGIDEYNTILGGTHLCAVAPEEYGRWVEELKQYKVARWRPAHCTAFKGAAFLARHFDDVDWAGAGNTIII